MSIEKARAWLAQFGAEQRILELDASSATVALAAEALHCAPARIAKTLSFMLDDHPILIVAAGDARIDNHRYKAHFGSKAKCFRLNRQRNWSDMRSAASASSFLTEDFAGSGRDGISCPADVLCGPLSISGSSISSRTARSVSVTEGVCAV